MSEENCIYDIVIIGAGTGGLVSASYLARLGLKVLLVDKNNSLGGECLHYGCVPSKKLISIAKKINSFKEGKKFVANNINIQSTNSEDDNQIVVNFSKVIKEVEKTIKQVQKHESLELFVNYGCDILLQEAQFIGPNTIAVGSKIIIGKKFIIATGSRAHIPVIEGIDKVPYYTNESILKLKKLPKQMVIIGAGPIGIEYAQIFTRLGSKVIVIETLDKILLGFDKEQTSVLEKKLKKEGIEFYINHQPLEVSSIINRDENLNVKIKIVNNTNNSEKELLSDCLFIAAGRKPNVDNLGLDNAKVNYSPHGIFVDARLRTNIKHIYALGDVTNNPLKFTYVAGNQAGILIKNIAFKIPVKVKNNLIPVVVYSDPELVKVGVTKTEAEKDKLSCQEINVPLKDLDKAIIDEATEGSLKLVVKNKKIIGASILAPNASELIPFLIHLIDNKYTVEALFNIIYPYPTISEIFQKASLVNYESLMFNTFSKSLVKFLNKYF